MFDGKNIKEIYKNRKFYAIKISAGSNIVITIILGRRYYVNPYIWFFFNRNFMFLVLCKKVKKKKRVLFIFIRSLISFNLIPFLFLFGLLSLSTDKRKKIQKREIVNFLFYF